QGRARAAMEIVARRHVVAVRAQHGERADPRMGAERQTAEQGGAFAGMQERGGETRRNRVIGQNKAHAPVLSEPSRKRKGSGAPQGRATAEFSPLLACPNGAPSLSGRRNTGQNSGMPIRAEVRRWTLA